MGEGKHVPRAKVIMKAVWDIIAILASPIIQIFWSLNLYNTDTETKFSVKWIQYK